MGVELYRHKVLVRAEKVEESGSVSTGTGPVHANAGDYLVYAESGITHLVSGPEFESGYERVGDENDAEEFAAEKEEEKESEKNTIDDYDPSAHTIPDVLKYLETANQEERERVFDAEADGEKRKGILDKRGDFGV
jgi:hypothetical protein